MSCQYGRADCKDTSDNEHDCPRTSEPEPESVTRARMMQWIEEGARSGFGTPLSGAMCKLLAKDYRLVREANGMALLYTVAPLNPTLSQKTAHIRAGNDICGWCNHVITPSNPHEECGPKAAA